ncbi:MAG: hypothetical protein KAJ19_17330 [Gammaproteobacteria bacterium]|nr:hypothetical protein [Gammaproteobacteria bacterium]
MRLFNLPRGADWEKHSYLVLGYGIDKSEIEEVLEKIKSLVNSEPGSTAAVIPQNPNCELYFFRVK